MTGNPNPNFGYQPPFMGPMPAYQQQMMPPPMMPPPPYMAHYGYQSPTGGYPYLAPPAKSLLPALPAPPVYSQTSVPGPERHEATKMTRPQPYPPATKEGENPLTPFVSENIPARLPKDIGTAATEGVPGYSTGDM